MQIYDVDTLSTLCGSTNYISMELIKVECKDFIRSLKNLGLFHVVTNNIYGITPEVNFWVDLVNLHGGNIATNKTKTRYGRA